MAQFFFGPNQAPLCITNSHPPDKCFSQTSLFSFPSQVWWIHHLSSLWPWSHPSILPIKYWAQVNISSSCSAAMVSFLGLEESFRGSHQAFFFLSSPLLFMKLLVLSPSPAHQWERGPDCQKMASVSHH